MNPKPKIPNQLVMIIETGTIVLRSAIPIADWSLRPGGVYAPGGDCQINPQCAIES